MVAAHPSTILVGANLRDPSREDCVGSAVAIHGGRIVAVGGDDLAHSLRGDRSEVIDLHGATVVPGLVDAHCHPVLGVALHDWVDLSSCATLRDIRSRLSDAASSLAPDAWLTAWGLDPNAFGREALTADAVGPVLHDRPAMLFLFDGHACIASREALRRAGIDGSREFASRSRVVCDESGRPTGHLIEDGAIDLVRDIIPTASFVTRLDRLAKVLDDMAATGLTGAHVMDLGSDDLALYAELEHSGRMPLRLRLSPWCRPDDGAQARDRVRDLQGTGGRLWTVAGVKLFIDGTIDGGTAWLHEPDVFGESTAAYWRDPADYGAAVDFFASAGIATATHAIGDAAVQHVLDTVERLERRGRHRTTGARHRVEHIETLAEDQLARFRALDVVASMQPTHATDYTRADHSENWGHRLGGARADRGWRCRDLLDAGALLALGSDWPVAPFDPRGVLAAAVSRRSPVHPDRSPVGPDQGLTARQALTSYTRGPAYASGLERTHGRLAVGHVADLTILEQDPTEVPPSELPDLPVSMTVVDGMLLRRDV